MSLTDPSEASLEMQIMSDLTGVNVAAIRTHGKQRLTVYAPDWWLGNRPTTMGSDSS
jgi:hypothetical protein